MQSNPDAAGGIYTLSPTCTAPVIEIQEASVFIKEITNQIRNDLYGVLECEGCHATEKLVGGYDDDNWHDNVLPNRKCKACGKSAREIEAETPKAAA